jgi:hypothetical protein
MGFIAHSSVLPRQVSDLTLWENRALTLDKVDRALWGKPRTLS